MYRLVHFPASEDADLVVWWLWSDRQGVFSHETALVRHRLSDLLPHDIEMTVPLSWKGRRVTIPEGLRLYVADVPPEERSWYGPVPITTPARTVRDCAQVAVSPEHLDQAVQQGVARGLFAPNILWWNHEYPDH